MINATGNLVINQSGGELSKSIRASLAATSAAILDAYGMRGIDVHLVTTKTFRDAAFPKFVTLGSLKHCTFFHEDYVINAYAAYIAGPQGITTEQFNCFTCCVNSPELAFKRTYARQIKTGLGLFLLSLHVRQAITLPWTFNWPTNRTGESKSSVAAKTICENSELLRFVRSIETVRGSVQDRAFSPVGYDQKRIEWFSTYGTKLLLASGWHSPEDVSLKELIELRKADQDQVVVSVYETLLETLSLKFGSRINVTPSEWSAAVRAEYVDRKQCAELDGFVATARLGDADSNSTIFGSTVKLAASLAQPEKLMNIVRNHLLDSNVQNHAAAWIELENVYLKNVRRESYKQPIRALACLNLYLFFYLTAWFKQNRNTSFEFPRTPSMLTRSVYISRLLRPDEDAPSTFVEFMKARQIYFGQSAESAYGDLKQVEVFFRFLEDNASELPGCEKFKQPLTRRDFPKVSGSLGTDKRPLPKKLFKPFLDFTEAVTAYFNTINKMVLNDEIDKNALMSITSKLPNIIDTQFVENAYSVPSPSFTVGTRVVKIQYVPNLLVPAWFTLKDGRKLKLLRPHALNQILVGIYTGLRHNHIQWLDADNFDKFVEDEQAEYCKLFVNTDKAKKKPWTPYTNKRVIQILRAQLEWRSLIASDGFSRKHYYNDNPQTSYPQFRPLFSYSEDGTPHNDSVYAIAWQDLLSSFQSLVGEILGREDHGVVLCKLKPPGVEFHDLEEKNKLKKHAKAIHKCRLTVKSDITPHSTRSAIVTYHLTYLRPDLLGKYVTGQTAPTVFHYVRPDPEELERQQVFQAMDLSRRAFEQGIEEFIQDDPSSLKRFIKADEVNSRLARSARKDIGQTVARYGCISITSLDEDDSDGIDILKEKGVEQAAFNKTEICPYGNHCPESVVKSNRGVRRCSLCPFAVRSVDHLPALLAKERQVAEMLAALDLKIENGGSTYSDRDLDELEEERQRLGEEYAGWRLCSEALEIQRQRVVAGEDSRKWIVERPEIIEQDLRRLVVPSGPVEYLLARLQECVAYPGSQSPNIRAQFDIMRRRVLASSSETIQGALALEASVEPAFECVGLLRTIAAAHRLTAEDVVELLGTEKHLQSLPERKGTLNLLGPAVSRLRGDND